jgi:chromosome segregation ATPase
MDIPPSGSLDAINQRSPPSDPRVRSRVTTTHAVQQNAGAGVGRLADRDPSYRDDTPSTGTPHSHTGRLDNAQSVLIEHQELHRAFLQYTRNAQNTEFLARRLKFLRHERNVTREDVEQNKKTRDKFPILFTQAREKHAKLDAEYQSTKEEEARARRAHEASSAEFISSLVAELTRKEDQKEKEAAFHALNDQVSVLQQEVKDLRTQQARIAADTPVLLQEMQKAISGLEKHFTEGIAESVKSTTFHQQLAALKHEMDEQRNSHVRDHQGLKHQLEAMQVAQSNHNKETNSKASEILEARIRPLELRLEEWQVRHAADQDLLKQSQAASTSQQATEFERFRKSINLKVENVVQEVPAIKDKLGALTSELSGTSQGYSDIVDRVGNIEALIKSADMAQLEGLTDDLDSLKRTGQDQYEEVQALNSHCEELTEKINLLESRPADTGSAIDVLEGLNQLRSVVSQYTSERKTLEEKVKQDLEALRQQIQESLEGAAAAVDSRFAKEVEISNRDLSHAVLEVQNGQRALESSFEDLQRSQSGAQPGTSIRGLETQVAGMQKALDKLSHMFANLNQRFNNLTTETLARQMSAVMWKALPKMENVILELGKKCELLQYEINALGQAGLPGDIDAKIQLVEQAIRQVKEELQGKLGELEHAFGEARDMAMKNIGETADAVARHTEDYSNYRESTAQSVKAIETRLDDHDISIYDHSIQLEDVRSRELFPSKNRRTRPETPTASSNTQPKLGNHVVRSRSRSAEPGRLPRGAGNLASRTIQESPLQQTSEEDEDDSQEAPNPEALLEMFKNRVPPSAPKAPHNDTPVQRRETPPVRQSSRGRPKSKRKRSLDFEDSDTSSQRGPPRAQEFSTKGRSSRQGG